MLLKTFFGFFLVAFPCALAFGQSIVPTAPGTTWRYHMSEETGEGLGLKDLTPADDGKVHLPVIYRNDGTEKVDGKDLLKFEMHRAGVVTNTDLLTIDEHGIVCLARVDQAREMTKLDPPQTIVAWPLKAGTTWNFDSEIGGAKVHQHYAVITEEDVKVQAGKFRAFHIHGEQTQPSTVTIDRWFVKGTGIVKDVTTMRSADGDLQRRITLELVERPKVTPRPQVQTAASTKKLDVSVSEEAVGEGMTQFGPDTEKIYARWQGHGLRNGAKVRAVWIAENIGDVAPPDYTIDEAGTVATAADSHGLFTLSRPEDGWAPGDYRVEFYVDEALEGTAKLKISK